MHLIIANKLYSSWSMRPWLVLKAFAIPFEETVIPLKQPDTAERIKAVSPTGKVPVLIDGEAVVWESLAIISHLADRFPDLPIWPTGHAARAHAKSIAMEMHAGFMALRKGCPMNLGKRFETPEIAGELADNISRIEEIFTGTRARFGQSGPFLFGAFTAADAMFAPVVTRLDTYQLPASAETRAYMEAVMSHPAFVAWRTAALAEPWTVAAYEAGHTAIADFRATQG